MLLGGSLKLRCAVQGNPMPACQIGLLVVSITMLFRLRLQGNKHPPLFLESYRGQCKIIVSVLQLWFWQCPVGKLLFPLHSRLMTSLSLPRPQGSGNECCMRVERLLLGSAQWLCLTGIWFSVISISGFM